MTGMNAWSIHGVKGYIHMSNTGTIARNRLMVRAWSNDGVKGYIHMPGMHGQIMV